MTDHPSVRRVVIVLVALWTTAVVAGCSDGEEDTGVASTSTAPTDAATTLAPLVTSPPPAAAAEGGTDARSLQDSTSDRLVAAGFAPSEASCIGTALFTELAAEDLTAALEALAPLGPDGAPLPVDESALDPVAAEILRGCRE